jgi:tryptophanyl-tRNA synthetase
MSTGTPRVVSGMRPAGPLHLADYVGTLKTWLSLQEHYECFFFVADWHGLATSYQDTSAFRQRITDTVIDWLSVGIDPRLSTLFVQSRVAEAAELNLLLSMCTPVTWLERAASARAQHLAAGEGDDLDTVSSGGDADHATGGLTLGQLGYPLLQACDMLIYRPTHVCLSGDQVSHVELARDVAGRFNHLFGRETDGEQKVQRALKRLGRAGETFLSLRRAYQERGDEEAWEAGAALLQEAPGVTVGDRERLTAYLEGSGRSLLAQPEAMLVHRPDLPGTDGRPMTHRRGNTIALRDKPDVVASKIMTMPTDPARGRRTDPGTPEKCPVWRYHEHFGDEATRRWVLEGCPRAAIGCTECKQHAADAVHEVLEPVRDSAGQFKDNPEIARSIIVEGAERARDLARDTMSEVRRAMSLDT